MKAIARFCETINILEIKNNIGQRLDNTIFKKEEINAVNDTKIEKISKIVSLIGAYDKKVVAKAPFRMLGAFWCKFWCKTKTELCRYLGYARVVNSVSHQLTKLICDNQIIEINKKYHLK